MTTFIYSVILSIIILGCYLIYDKKANMNYIKIEKINTYIILISFSFSFFYFIAFKDQNTIKKMEDIQINIPKAPF